MGDGILWRVTIGTVGGEGTSLPPLCADWMGPIVIDDGEVDAGADVDAKMRMIVVPYDNDAYVPYQSVPIDGSAERPPRGGATAARMRHSMGEEEDASSWEPSMSKEEDASSRERNVDLTHYLAVGIHSTLMSIPS